MTSDPTLPRSYSRMPTTAFLDSACLFKFHRVCALSYPAASSSSPSTSFSVLQCPTKPPSQPPPGLPRLPLTSPPPYRAVHRCPLQPAVPPCSRTASDPCGFPQKTTEEREFAKWAADSNDLLGIVGLGAPMAEIYNPSDPLRFRSCCCCCCSAPPPELAAPHVATPLAHLTTTR